MLIALKQFTTLKIITSKESKLLIASNETEIEFSCRYITEKIRNITV